MLRSELVPLAVASRKKRCQFCSELGYLRDNADQFESEIANCRFSNSSFIVTHIQILENKSYQQLKALLLPDQEIFFVSCSKCLPKPLLDLDTSKVAVIFNEHDEVSEIENSLNQFYIGYFFIDLNGSSYEKWKAVPEYIKQRMKIFTKYCFDRHSSADFSAWYQFVEEQKEKIVYEVPFNHDIIDEREPHHIDWIFKPEFLIDTRKLSVSPKISVVVAFYNRTQHVLKVIKALFSQKFDGEDFEIILLNDGGPDDDSQIVAFLKQHPQFQVVYQRIPRKSPLSNLFIGNRVGPVRNLGARVSRSPILLFLDSDILLPADYLSGLEKIHESVDVFMPLRKYLSERSSQALADRMFFQEQDFVSMPWEQFQNVVYARPWNSVDHPWKYFMTFCLSVKKSIFLKTGGFRTNYIAYGYEDVDLGFRLANITNNFAASLAPVFHLYHFYKSEEYDLGAMRRYFQLALTSRVFYFQNCPRGGHHLDKMMSFHSKRQQWLFSALTRIWQMRKFFRKLKIRGFAW